ncbi:MAG TPA: hypothetical protein VNQ76_16190 [Planctomicrobium sp.]|nr:hypothetical protein [Planctomicrobium sp.]
MGAKIVSFLATLLLSIPLAAIGLMAIFGVPQLLPAGPERDQVVRGLQKAFNWRTDSETAQTDAEPAYEDAVPFGQENFQNSPQESSPFRSATSFQGESRQENTRNPNERRTSSDQWTRDSSRSINSGTGAGTGTMAMAPSSMTSDPSNRRGPFSSGNSANGNPNGNRNQAFQNSSPTPFNGPLLSWRQATSRLNELGIRNYHLERGATDGTFLFVCLYSPPEAAQVIHRFESETDDPLVSVNQVLHQVDEWMRTRVPSPGSPSSPFGP